ncbi:hypothetical protein M433DRAFT_484392 [Acidomyces richmondensis BFW]|nr:MAG: hypothetical protein FE78DRAFT_279971 [Acidomyces sp. 'richmondensis']KYG47666.1 hypothetical protein M433DRAFT_484392 [Acidomyces richmondensis BFW]
MPSRKRNARPQPPIVPQSDYDTDTAAITDAAPALAPPPKRTNTELNLQVLRRYVPSISAIVAIAPFAVVYTFTPDTQQWEKCGIEGTLFVCQVTPGRYIVFVLNRKSLENLTVELRSADDVEVTQEYVILQSQTSGPATDHGDAMAPAIYGIWIFSDDAEATPSVRDVIAQTIVECSMRAQIAREAAADANGGGTDGYERHEPSSSQAYGYGCRTDEATQMQQQLAEKTVDSLHQDERLELKQLFGNRMPSRQGAQTVPLNSAHTPPVSACQRPSVVPEARFTPTADTEFFRSARGPAHQQQP